MFAIKYLMRQILSLACAMMIVTTGLVMPAYAAQTGWQEAVGGKVRLISGGVAEGRYKAGLEIVLDEGWKTYWKVPGDSGIPPLLDFSASRNSKDIQVAWPVPSRIRVGGSDILGYKDAIIFPIFIAPEDASRRTALSLTVHLGLCSDLCVPMVADLAVEIPAGGQKDLVSEMLIDRDLALVPGAATQNFGIKQVSHVKGEDGAADQLRISAQIPDGYGDKDLFVEGPETWLLPLAQKDGEGPDGAQHFTLLLDGLPKGGQSKGIDLRFTLTNGEEAVEQVITLEK